MFWILVTTNSQTSAIRLKALTAKHCNTTTNAIIPIGVSGCLLGHNVRYDAQNRGDPDLLCQLGDQFDLLPLCPEVAIGLSVPRPPIHLIETEHGVKAIRASVEKLDYTPSLAAYVHSLLPLLNCLCGLILKSRSPSCGINSTEILDTQGSPLTTGSGIVASEIIIRLPQLPLIDEITLANCNQREQFLSRVILRSQQITLPRITKSNLKFH